MLKLYYAERHNRTIFTVVNKVGNMSIPVDIVTLGHRAPHMYIIASEQLQAGQRTVELPVSPELVEASHVRDVIHSWYGEDLACSIQTLKAADWLQDSQTIQLCVDALKLNSEFDVTDLLTVATRLNCEPLVQHCLVKIARYDTISIVKVLNRAGCFEQHQVFFVNTCSVRGSVLACLHALKSSPLKTPDMKLALARMFFPGDLEPAVARAIMAFQIMTDQAPRRLQDALCAAHPEVVTLLKEALQENIQCCDFST